MITILIQTISIRAVAGDIPEWVTNVLAEDDTYKYYVGIADNQTDLAEAFDEARFNAIQDAIRDNFGYETEINSDVYQTTQNLSAIHRIKQISKRIHLAGFELRGKYFANSNGNKKIVYALYGYRKSNIQAELQKQKSPTAAKPKLDYSIIGESSDSLKGSVEITSSPSRATVYIDGEPYPKTPLKLFGEISEGKHELRIDHPDFETIITEIIVNPRQRNLFHRVLVPAKGKITINTEPSGAMVFVDGKKIGNSPTNPVSLLTNSSHTIKLTHPKALPTIITDYYVKKDQNSEETFKMNLLPGTIESKNLKLNANSFETASKRTSGSQGPLLGLHLLLTGEFGAESTTDILVAAAPLELYPEFTFAVPSVFEFSISGNPMGASGISRNLIGFWIINGDLRSRDIAMYGIISDSIGGLTVPPEGLSTPNQSSTNQKSNQTVGKTGYGVAFGLKSMNTDQLDTTFRMGVVTYQYDRSGFSDGEWSLFFQFGFGFSIWP